MYTLHAAVDRDACLRAITINVKIKGEHTMKRISLPLVIMLTIVLLNSCAPGPNDLIGNGEDVAGFWLGIWHGFITLFTFVISLFSDNVSIYEVNNNGGWYNFGYLVGVMGFWGGGSGGACSSKRWCRDTSL